MSTCISWHGEYSEHTLDDSYVCTRCSALDEDAMLAEIVRLRLAHTTVSVVLDESGRYGRRAIADIERLRAELAEAKAERLVAVTQRDWLRAEATDDVRAKYAMILAVEGCVCSYTAHDTSGGWAYELNADADCPMHGEQVDTQLADIEARVAADKAVIEAAGRYAAAYRATTLRPLPSDVKIQAISEELTTARFALLAAVDAHNALNKPSTAAHRCPDCDQPTAYQSFSGGREWYCKPCDNHGLYPQGAAPRRLQMLADGRWDELRQEMRKEIAARRTVPSVVDGQPDAKAGNYGEYKHRLPLDPKGAGSAERGPLAIRSEEPDSSAATGDTAHGQLDTKPAVSGQADTRQESDHA